MHGLALEAIMSELENINPSVQDVEQAVQSLQHSVDKVQDALKAAFEEVEGRLLKELKILMGQRKSRVPDTFQLGAISNARAFLTGRKINNLCVLNNPEYSDSRASTITIKVTYH